MLTTLSTDGPPLRSSQRIFFARYYYNSLTRVIFLVYEHRPT